MPRHRNATVSPGWLKAEFDRSAQGRAETSRTMKHISWDDTNCDEQTVRRTSDGAKIVKTRLIEKDDPTHGTWKHYIWETEESSHKKMHRPPFRFQCVECGTVWLIDSDEPGVRFCDEKCGGDD